MRKSLIISVLLLLSFVVSAQKLVILHTNDMHQRIIGFGPELAYSPMITNNDNTIGGFARLAAIIDKFRAKYPNSLLLLDDGDFLMGTIYHVLEPQTGFEMNLLYQMGYDAVTFGNHEYDFGADALGQMIEQGLNRGGVPPFVVSYLKFSDKPGDDKLQKFYGSVIKPYRIIERNGLKIGIFSVLGDDAIADVKFAAPLKFENKIKVARRYVKILRNKEHVDIIICLSHSGVYPDGKGGFYGEDIDLAKKVKDIDIIISGHTHVVTPHYLKVGKTIIVQTGAYLHNIGKLVINYKDHQINVLDFQLIPIDDKIGGDDAINTQVNEFKDLITQQVLSKYGLKYNTVVTESDFNIPMSTNENPQPSPLGNLVTDAMKYYVNHFSNTHTDITLTANGVIRERLVKGKLIVPDLFRIVSLGFGDQGYDGYPLIIGYFTPHEIKQLLELTIFAMKPGTDKYLYFSGVKAYYNPKGGFLNKIKKLEINGKQVDFSRKNKTLYSITTDSYIFSFLGYIKKASHGLVKVVPKTKDGKPIVDPEKNYIDFDPDKPCIQEGKLWIGLYEYLKSQPDRNGNGIPDVPEKYKKYDPYLIKL